MGSIACLEIATQNWQNKLNNHHTTNKNKPSCVLDTEENADGMALVINYN